MFSAVLIRSLADTTSSPFFSRTYALIVAMNNLSYLRIKNWDIHTRQYTKAWHFSKALSFIGLRTELTSCSAVAILPRRQLLIRTEVLTTSPELQLPSSVKSKDDSIPISQEIKCTSSSDRESAMKCTKSSVQCQPIIWLDSEYKQKHKCAKKIGWTWVFNYQSKCTKPWLIFPSENITVNLPG